MWRIEKVMQACVFTCTVRNMKRRTVSVTLWCKCAEMQQDFVQQPEEKEKDVSNAAGSEVRAGEASVYGLSVPTPHVTSLSSH